jgi:hypothetical protein
MVICDRCKRDPVKEAANEALRQQPWGIMLTPPPGSGLSPRWLCWPCTLEIVDGWLLQTAAPVAPKAKK